MNTNIEVEVKYYTVVNAEGDVMIESPDPLPDDYLQATGYTQVITDTPLIQTGTNKYNFETKEFENIPTAPTSYHVWDSNTKKWEYSEELRKQELRDWITTSKVDIDNTAEGVYQRFTRFSDEYKERETQALRYKESGYKGEPPEQVRAFSVPAKLTGKDAADIILANAKKLRVGLSAIASLRMRKFELDSLLTVDEVSTRRDEIKAAINVLGAKL